MNLVTCPATACWDASQPTGIFVFFLDRVFLTFFLQIIEIMKSIKVGLLGIGTVGSGTFERIEAQSA